MIEMSYEEAWNNDEFQKIMHAASRFYTKVLDPDDLESLKMATLLKCLNRYDADSKMSFTTYLYTQIRYTIWNLLAKNSKKIKSSNLAHVNTDTEIRNIGDVKAVETIKDMMSSLNNEDRTLIQQRFFDNMTYEEIARSHNFTKETARRKIKYILNKCKRLV
jgi:RNA polymerase sigma factor (sigma-70 family)